MNRLTKVTLLFALLLALGALPAAAADRATDVIYEMPAAVMTGGLTVDQHIELQAQTAGHLLANFPARAREVRLALSEEEVAAIDQGDRSATPLKIGLVKPISHMEVFGLDTGSDGGQPRRGATGIVGRGQDGEFVWAVSVQVQRAGAIRLHLEGVSLPDGAELYVYTRGGEAYGPYRGAGPDGSGEFWMTTVFGPEAILQLHLPAMSKDALGDVAFKVTEIGVMTEKSASTILPAASFCGNAICIKDASCYSAANSIRDAYAKMEWPSGAYIYTCTAGLLNDSNPSLDNFFLTANHCFSSSKAAKNVTFYWRFRTDSCKNAACPSNSGWPYKTTGATVVASNRRGDFTLGRLIEAPPTGSVFLGWTNVAVADTDGVALHRVSNPQFGPQVYNEQTVDTKAGTCRGWPRGERIYSRDTLGGTDGGSSGSPVVNESDQVVGQLSGACGTNVNDPCDNTNNATVDGAFAYYFATVKPFLQP